MARRGTKSLPPLGTERSTFALFLGLLSPLRRPALSAPPGGEGGVYCRPQHGHTNAIAGVWQREREGRR